MEVPNFIGPSNTLDAITAAADRTINMYEEKIPPGVSGKGQSWLREVPGLEIFASLSGSGNQVELFSQAYEAEDRLFAVAGSAFYEVFNDGTWTNYGAVATDPLFKVTMCSNGTAGGQIFITSGGNGYIFDVNTNTLTLIADPDFPQGEAACGEFMDGYFLVLIRFSRRFQISALEDGTSWDGLDIAERSEGSDNLTAMRRSHREIWFLGRSTGEVWYDNGDPDFPFAPIQGVFIETGTPWVALLQRIANTVMWLNFDTDGRSVVYIADGYTPKRVSTHAIEDDIQGPEDISLAEAWTYQDRGHWFYSIHLEGFQFSLVYDLTMNRWDYRALLVDDTVEPWVWTPNRPISHTFCFGKHLVGDRLTGTIYEQSLEIFKMNVAST